jgi:hypothetical protein
VAAPRLGGLVEVGEDSRERPTQRTRISICFPTCTGIVERVDHAISL